VNNETYKMSWSLPNVSSCKSIVWKGKERLHSISKDGRSPVRGFKLGPRDYGTGTGKLCFRVNMAM